MHIPNPEPPVEETLAGLKETAGFCKWPTVKSELYPAISSGGPFGLDHGIRDAACVGATRRHLLALDFLSASSSLLR